MGIKPENLNALVGLDDGMYACLLRFAWSYNFKIRRVISSGLMVIGDEVSSTRSECERQKKITGKSVDPKDCALCRLGAKLFEAKQVNRYIPKDE